MSTSTRENMRRELKELAKLAETMGKQPVPAEPSEGAAVLASAGLQRPSTPASSSHMTVPPVAFPSNPPPVSSTLSTELPRKRTGFMALVIGASLAAALVGGAVVGKSLAGRPTTAAIPAEVQAAAIAAPPEPTPIVAAAPVVVAPTPDPAAAAPAAPVTGAAKNAAASNATAPTPPPAHKHWPKAAGTPALSAAAAPKPGVTTPAAAVNNDATSAAPVAAAKSAPAAPTPKATPAKAAAGGGTDSLEDLIRKEVAASKK